MRGRTDPSCHENEPAASGRLRHSPIRRARSGSLVSGCSEIRLKPPANLIKNALAYTSQGRIVIHITPEAWSICDTGMGFGRVEPEHTGFGIGLSLVERLARRFNWNLSISALEPRGTQVRLTWHS